MADRPRWILPSHDEFLGFARGVLSVWTERGFLDDSCTIHSAGVTLWTALGLRSGYSAISEMPAPGEGTLGRVGGDVRSDSAWLERGSGRPTMLVEFERYAGASDEPKLEKKLENLLLAYHRWGGYPRDVVLAYWSKGLADLPRHEALRRRIRDGFRTRAMEPVGGANGLNVHFVHFVLRQAGDGLWRLWRVEERGKP